MDIIYKPSRVTDETASIIDHIWSSDYNNLTKSYLLYSSITDHFPFCTCFNFERNNRENNEVNFIEIDYRNYSEVNIIALT